MIDLNNNLSCCGCSACVSICPTGCIEMAENNEGFQVPRLVNGVKCLECNLCVKACPVINPQKEEKHFEKGFIVQNINDKIREESTSGGAFTAIAISVISKGGIVYGAAFDDNFKVIHIGIESEKELSKFRNSKYVQSNLGEVFKEVKTFLIQGRYVCFSGTPCQIEGLNSFLKKDYNNLILVDVVCHGISSPLIWRKYLELQSIYNPEKIYFRWKHFGYKYSTMSLMRKNQEVYFNGIESDPMLQAYFTNNCDLKACYDCKFKKRYRVSDFTIWDCYQPGYFNKSYNDDKGTSSLLINSEKGMEEFENIKKMGLLRYHEVLPDDLTFGNNEMIHSIKKGAIRDNFLSDASTLNANQLFNKYFPISTKTKVVKRLRRFLLSVGIYSRIKYALFLYRRNKTNPNKENNI